jgi:uncharacterized protein YciI
MFILTLTYIARFEEIDEELDAHMAWVKKGYADGHFIASGRTVPHTAGMILARGERTAIEAFCAADPFAVYGVVEYEIAEVAFTTVAPGAEILKS